MVTTPLAQKSNMNTYVFPPTTSQDFFPHTEYLNYFSPPECDALIAAGKILFSDGEGETTRSWLEYTQNYAWIWDKLASLAVMANTRNYHFTLVGFLDKLQLTVDTAERGYYEWHMDYGAGALSTRKLSLLLQLSDPESYTGGDIELFYKAQPVVAQRVQGTAVVFPSYIMHHSTPVTQGERYTLTAWASGIETYK